MTVEQAIQIVRSYQDHEYAYEVTDDGTIVVGGTDHLKSISVARADGHFGQVRRVYDAA